jgi:prolyl-tRNA editing enzyme YbaK/EbsC (Cys-tRNA(Pro) deacylase)
MMISTKITRLLDEQNIPYTILPHADPVYTVEAAAAQRGVVLDEMVKSILLRERKKRRYVMACVPGAVRVNPQAVREHLPGAWKRLSFASAEEITAATGYTQGSVAPLALPPEIPVVMDNAFLACVRVNLATGNPMAGLEMDFADLRRMINPLFASIASQA